MKTLLVLRHGKSSWKDPDLDDHDRPLNKRGQRDAPRMGRLLRDLDLVPDLVVSSTAKRAHDTAEMAAETAGYSDDVCTSSELYHAGPMAWIDELRQVSDIHQCVMVVGHNPGLEELVETLSDQSEILPTAALAQITLPIESWQDLSIGTPGELENLWRPKELEDIAES
jgi:phosphohistidine phosphatase